MYWQNFKDYPKPIAVKGGIKSASKRGQFARTWWARRWLAVLEALNLGGRLQRAKTYARKGQVLDLTIEAGQVTARVQGSRPKPYEVTIKIRQLANQDTARLARELSNTPYILAKLLSREMPPDIERLFEATRLSLFPARASELHTDCSCPDWSNPCKHIAAVYYLLGEEFDRDPFLIFRLRGIDVESLTGAPEVVVDEPAPERGILRAGAKPPENFWEGSRPEVDLTPPAQALKDAPRLRCLGNLPFWRGEEPVVEALEPAYSAGSARAISLLGSGGGATSEA